jgi:hypothetical protein
VVPLDQEYGVLTKPLVGPTRKSVDILVLVGQRPCDARVVLPRGDAAGIREDARLEVA